MHMVYMYYQYDTTWTHAVYRKTPIISRTLVANQIVEHLDVVGASPVGVAPTTSSFSTQHLASRYSAKAATRQYENILSAGIWCILVHITDLMVINGSADLVNLTTCNCRPNNSCVSRDRRGDRKQYTKPCDNNPG